MQKLIKEELVAIIVAHRADSLGVEDGELTNDRADALDRYHGRLYGNELEGRSKIVSKDLSEAIDWAMPAIMRVFTQSGTVAEFDPVSPEDEPQAEIETAYVNQVIMKDNAGWVVLHDAIKDTLLLKNGYVKHFWDDCETVKEERYKGLVIEEVQTLLSQLQQDGAKVEVIGQDEGVIQTANGQVPVFDINLRITRKEGKLILEAVPCEEIRVSRKCRGSLQTSPFTEHVTKKTRSDLVEMGMDKEFVYGLSAYTGTNETDSQVIARDSVTDESYGADSVSFDRSMDEIEYCEAYIKVDFDGDGVAELRRVVTVANQIPDGDEWNQIIPEVAITGFVAKRIPHRHVGESLYDELGDLQEIKTTLLRQLFDNIFATNNNQWLVNERVNIKDFMTSLPGGIKRVEGMEPVGGAVEPVMSQPIIGQVLPVLDYIDGVKESRTGISKTTTGLDPDSLSMTTKGAFMENMNRASQKVEMITRMIAETGVKEMVLRVHSLLLRYQNKQRMIRMKGKFVPINPQEWRERTDLTVKVGLGTGNEEDRQRKLMMVADLQNNLLAPRGMVDAPQAHALFSDIAKTLGFDAPDKYAMSPQSPEYQQKLQQPPPQDPKIMLEQAKMQMESQQSQAQMQIDMQMQQMQAQAKLQETQAQLELQASNDARDSEREMQKAEMDYRLAEQQLVFDKWKTEYDRETQIIIEQMKQSGQAQQQFVEAANGSGAFNPSSEI